MYIFKSLRYYLFSNVKTFAKVITSLDLHKFNYCTSFYRLVFLGIRSLYSLSSKDIQISLELWNHKTMYVEFNKHSS